MDVRDWMEESTILLVRRGSHAYGTATPESDIDLGGICIPPEDYTLGAYSFEQFESKQPYDSVIYSLKKFINLASNCNPNIIEHLYTDENDILHINHIGKELLKHRDIFLTKRARHTFGGYAFAQLKKLNLKLGETEAAEQRDYMRRKLGRLLEINNLAKTAPEATVIINADLKEFCGLVTSREEALRKIKEAIDRTNSQLASLDSKSGGGNHGHHGSHKHLIDAYGFDTKHAMHLIRLLDMGIEILEHGICLVKRPNFYFLNKIRRGGYSLDDVQSMAEERFNQMEDAYKNSDLPNSPDLDKINDLMIRLNKLGMEPKIIKKVRNWFS